jgi:hypothetical protein
MAAPPAVWEGLYAQMSRAGEMRRIRSIGMNKKKPHPSSPMDGAAFIRRASLLPSVKKHIAWHVETV